MVMNEKLKALEFYRLLLTALKSDGVKSIRVILVDGDLEAHVESE